MLYNIKVTLKELRADSWEEDVNIEESLADLMWDPVKVFIKYWMFCFQIWIQIEN